MARCTQDWAPMGGNEETRCIEDASHGGLCIFHDPNLAKDIKALRDRLETRLAEEAGETLQLFGAIFPDGVSFEGKKFNRDINFYAAHFFHGPRLFDHAEFHGGVSFSCAQFHGQRPSFEHAKFLGETHFDAAIFHHHIANFNNAEFEGITYFEQTAFRHGALFIHAVFCDKTSFEGTNFLGDTYFKGAQFRGETIFYETRFHSPKTTVFSKAQFHGQKTEFREAEFKSQTTDFREAVFGGQTIFRGRRPKDVFLGQTADLSQIIVAGQGKLVFDWVDLSRTQFRELDLSRVRFLDVTWNHAPEWKIGPLQWGRWRSRVYAEALWRDARRDPKKRLRRDTEDLPQLGRPYRALKAYYRDTGELQLVGHFHYGLMEVQWYQREIELAETGGGRFQQKWAWLKRKIKKYGSWEALYRISSGYGEDYALAGLVLIGLLIAFAGFYWWLGIPKEMNDASWWEQVLHSLLYSFQVGTFGRVNFYQIERVGLAARYLHLFESVLVPVQFGFFLFALRNRFRR